MWTLYAQVAINYFKTEVNKLNTEMGCLIPNLNTFSFMFLCLFNYCYLFNFLYTTL